MFPYWDEILGIVGGLATGGLMTAIWQTVFGRKKAKLAEAEALSRISTAIREEIREENRELRERMDRIVDAVVSLTDLLDDIFPKLSGLNEEERTSLRRKINAAKRAT